MAFNDFIGHEKTIATLQQTLRTGSIAQAYLFYGREGVGKKSIAIGFAKAMNCLEGNADFCDSCQSCSKIVKRVHPDFFFIEPQEHHLKIEQLRQLQSALSYKPYMAKWRICVIDQAERMTLSAANSILKILEEPPSNTVFILIAANIDQILPTIRSRCQVRQFSPLSTSAICNMVSEKVSIAPQKARLIATMASGSLGKALQLDTDCLESDRQKIFQLCENPYSMNIEYVFAEIKKLAKEKTVEELHYLLNVWLYWYYDIWKYQITGNDMDLLNIDKLDQIHDQSRRMSSKDMEKSIRAIKDACNALEYNANKQLTIEVLIMKLSTKCRMC